MFRRRVVILGSGTNVGKTYVGEQLLRAWRRSGISSLGLKPIESGITPSGELQPHSDAGRLAAAANHGTIPLYQLPDPLSPHLAAQLAGQRVDLRRVETWVHNVEEEKFGADPDNAGITLIETAGGAFSPVNEEATNFELALRLLPAVVVLVAPDALGVLHDVSATLRAMVSSPPTFVALSEARGRDSSTGRNATELERVVYPRLGAAAPHEREVVTISAGEKADFLADRILRLF